MPLLFSHPSAPTSAEKDAAHRFKMVKNNCKITTKRRINQAKNFEKSPAETKNPRNDARTVIHLAI